MRTEHRGDRVSAEREVRRLQRVDITSIYDEAEEQLGSIFVWIQVSVIDLSAWFTGQVPGMATCKSLQIIDLGLELHRRKGVQRRSHCSPDYNTLSINGYHHLKPGSVLKFQVCACGHCMDQT